MGTYESIKYDFDGSNLTGLATGGGKVLQVVEGTDTATRNTQSHSYTDTGLSASITPASTSNKILITVTYAGADVDGYSRTSSGKSTTFYQMNDAKVNLLRGSTQLEEYRLNSIHGEGNDGVSNTTENNGTDKQDWIAASSMNRTISFQYLDSPSTTSATTYKTQFLETSVGTTDTGSITLINGRIQLMEIDGT